MYFRGEGWGFTRVSPSLLTVKLGMFFSGFDSNKLLGVIVNSVVVLLVTEIYFSKIGKPDYFGKTVTKEKNAISVKAVMI